MIYNKNTTPGNFKFSTNNDSKLTVHLQKLINAHTTGGASTDLKGMLRDTTNDNDNLKLQRSLTMIEPPKSKKNLMRGLLSQISNVSNGDSGTDSRRVIPLSPANDFVLT